MHKRNIHAGKYNLELLATGTPELSAFIFVNEYGNESIDFFDPEAVKLLNQALLKEHYGIEIWDIPEGYLCPPVPGRADYIHHLADLMHGQAIPKGKQIRVLDIGTGANCIYPILGSSIYQWQMVGSESDIVAYENAKAIVTNNKKLQEHIEIRLQGNPNCFYQGIMEKDEIFDATMCNPPFYGSAKEARAANRKKFKSLNPKSTRSKNLNFGGQSHELWTKGGEEVFVHNMIHESRNFSNQCFWFSTLVSKEDILQSVYKALKRAKVEEYKMVEMSQGHKKSRFVAWTFLKPKQQEIWKRTRWVSEMK